MKKIERNPFNEKLLHRYIFERLYFGSKKIKKNLLPRNYHSKIINLIVPEQLKKNDQYRVDLTIYFQDKNKGIPVEIKWNSSQNLGKFQEKYLKKNNGIIISFSEKEEMKAKYPGIDITQIDYKDFSLWIAENINKLCRESLIYKANISKLKDANQKWIVFLRGADKDGSHGKWRELIKNNKNKYKPWCFKGTSSESKGLERMFNMQKGDECIFILGHNSIQNVRLPKGKPNQPLLYSGWHLTEINEPYYIDLDNKDFEDLKRLSINKRKWVHFLNFTLHPTEEWLGSKVKNKNKNFKKNYETLDFGPRGELDHYLVESANTAAGTPISIPNHLFNDLISKLRQQRPLSYKQSI